MEEEDFGLRNLMHKVLVAQSGGEFEPDVPSILSGHLIDTLMIKEEAPHGQPVIQLRTNKILKGLLALENLFDTHDTITVKLPSQRIALCTTQETQLCTVKDGDTMRKVHIGDYFSPKEEDDIMALCKEF